MIVGVVGGRIAKLASVGIEFVALPFSDLGQALLAGHDADSLAAAPGEGVVEGAEVVTDSPVGPGSALWAVGLSYRDHALEAGAAAETEGEIPALFLKASSSINCAHGDIVLPSIAPSQVDYEGEVAIVIGRGGKEIDAADGWDHVFGITAANDVSARDVQMGKFLEGHLDPSKGKSFDTFTPLGPWVATPDEFPDREAIGLRTVVNGALRQEANTRELLRPIPSLVAAVSRFATLRPGDVILTGTPAGVGFPRGLFLEAGDDVRVEVDVVGELRNRVTLSSSGSTMSAGPAKAVDGDAVTSTPPEDVMIRPRELHHVTFKTNDIDGMVRFYSVLTGHAVMFQGETFAAISFDDANHRIALLALAPWEELPREQRETAVGLHHVAYEYDSLDELTHTYSRAKRAGIKPEWTVNHGPTMSFYYRDPDGNGIELQVDNCDHDLDRWTEIIEGPFQLNQMGINVDPEKIIAALSRGVGAAEIVRDSYKTEGNPYAAPGFGPPGLNMDPPPGLNLPDVS